MPSAPGGDISRKRFLAGAGAAAAGLAVAAGPALTPDRAAAKEGSTPPAGKRRGLAHRGVCYEVADGETPHTGWNATRMRADMKAIREKLHANAVSVYGDGVDRLKATASEAAERGLKVWLQPRLADRPHKEILDHLAETGEHAERLRRQGVDVHLSVGCEFYLFVPGIVPGADAVERVRNLQEGNFDPVKMQRRLESFIARAAKTGRSVFQGPLTYGAAQDDEVDWGLFDVVSVDYYAYHRRRADHVKELKSYLRWGKPVAIAECGACTFKGAPQDGGMGWDVVDYEKDPPEVKKGLVRSEREQASYLSDVLGIFEEMGLHAAMIFNFVTPDAPHRPVRRYDLDMASYALVKPIWKTPTKPTADWHWEPKEAFHAAAAHFARAAAR
ncbi:abortive phage infection protein [Streptomyces sp. NPDC048172]|uniref:abortive phage infection protein n=1 Tax=Streptomyces sp. NPDC048172 TaxID=3365505 RepID=UPI003719E590